MRELTIGKNDAGQRLDRFVAKNLPLSGVIFSNGKFPHEHPPFSLWTALIIPAFSRVVKRGAKIKEAKL